MTATGGGLTGGSLNRTSCKLSPAAERELPSCLLASESIICKRPVSMGSGKKLILCERLRDREDFDFQTILNDVKSIMMSKCQEKNLYFKINHPKDVSTYFIGDSGRFRQILINLVTLIKYESPLVLESIMN